MLALGASAFLAGAGIRCTPSSSPVTLESLFSDPPSTDKKNMVVFLSDTLRADHLGCYGHNKNTSPNLDALAKDGVLFEQCFSVAHWTKPSISSMMTGVAPRVHQAVIHEGSVRDLFTMTNYRVQVLRDQFTTLAELMKSQGYYTHYILSNPHGKVEFGYGQGFDRYSFKKGYSPHLQVSDAIKWIAQIRKEPFFIWVHVIDPHGPYRPTDETFFELHGTTKEEELARLPEFDAEQLQEFISIYGHRDDRPEIINQSESANAYFQMLYDAEIRQVDHQLGRIMKFLKRHQAYDRTIFAMISDHGEGFREHGFYGHGTPCAYDELVHVPLVIGSGGIEKNVRVPQTVSILDLYPTLATLAGAKIPDYITGSTLLTPEGKSAVTEDRPAYIDIDHKNPDLNVWDSAIAYGQYKISTFDSQTTTKIFDRKADPGEKHDLLSNGHKDSELAKKLTAMLDAETRKHDDLRAQFGEEPEWVESSQDDREELEALGYV